MELKEKKCEPCEGGIEPFNDKEINEFINRIESDWKVIEHRILRKKYLFENFKRGMAFVQEVARIAEDEQHHPDIYIHYDNVVIELSTHNIGGLSENDFIMAAKIDDL
ncbi:MAG: 4a-hydroxytetrahydrobiopterin dehydratase [Bacteroidales bacterium]|nr:4a-hydroxytetrahydrobiopterin dehydratase [Bacteroidales bacterium]